jgi:hypothetical protein
VRIETGSLYTPSGEQYNGFKITVGGIIDPCDVKRIYDDIEKILGKHQVPYKIHEEHTASGTFKSYSVET